MPPLLWSNAQGGFWGWNTGTAAGGETGKYALFFLAYTSAGYTLTTNTYSYTALTSIVNFGQPMPTGYGPLGSAAGNTEKGVFASNGNSAIYTYQTNSVVLGRAFPANSSPYISSSPYFGCATGNATVGLFAYGIVFSSSGVYIPITTTAQYSYAADTWGASASLLQAVSHGAATSTSTDAMVVVGNANDYTNLYNYATNAVTQGSTFAGYVHFNTACGNSSSAVFSTASAGAGAGTDLYFYTYASAVWGPMYYLLVAAEVGMGAANSAFGVIASGNGTASTATFDFTSYAVTAGQSLTAPTSYGCATSTSNTGVIS